VIGQALGKPKVLAEVVGAMLEPEHFYRESYSVIYAEMVSAYYADEPTDALSIAAACAKNLEHAKLVKRHADYRALLDLAAQIKRDVDNELDSPEQIAGLASQTAMQVATSDAADPATS
jgi:replicative DNA helicase